MRYKYGSIVFLLVLFALTIGAKSIEYKVVTVDNGASIKGKITFRGKVPQPKQILITKDHELCGTGNREIQWVELGQSGKGLQNVAVYIAEISQGKGWSHPDGGYQLNQKGCRFIPDFFAVPNGQDLRLLNDDPTLHNIHAYEMIGKARRTLFNVGQPGKRFRITKGIITRRGNTVKIECDAHNFMHAWIFVPANPYFSLVNEKGEYSILDVPAGTYLVKVWHPTLGERESEVTLESGQSLSLNFNF